MQAAVEFATTEDGCQLWTATSGSGPPLVLCHGGPGFWDNLGPVAEMVDDLMTVHRWDQRGAGRSNRVGPYSVARFVTDLEVLKKHWDYESWIVGGHSFGASLALFYALAYPQRTRALIYISGVGVGQKWHEAYREERLRRLADKAERWLELRSKERDPQDEREYAALNWSADFADRTRALELAEAEVSETGFYDLLFPNDETNRTLNSEMNSLDEETLIRQCEQLHYPVLILHGESDPRPAWALDSLVAGLPEVQLEILPSCGHLPWIEQAELTKRILREFLSSADVRY
jgi:proline iminopeptidase